MLLPQIRLILEPIDSSKQFRFVSAMQNPDVNFKPCALTYKLQEAIDRGAINPGHIISMAVTDVRNNKITTTNNTAAAIQGFFARHSGLHAFAASQHMSEAGKFLASRTSIEETLSILWNQDFSQRLDTNRWFKLAQIACQSGYRVDPSFTVRAYFDRKHDDEDGIIFVNPDIWPDILAAYSTDLRVLHSETQLIKINSCESDLTIKALLMRATGSRWKNLQRRAGRSDFDFFMCGHAVKDNSGYEIGRVYELSSDRFAYHADSSQHRGYGVNVSKTLLFRSGMNVSAFLDEVQPESFEILRGIMQFEEDAIIKSLGGLEDDEIALESMSALKRRMVEQCIPANHPVNVRNVYEQGKAIIRQQISKIRVPGFHGMGGPFESIRGRVGVSPQVFDRWIEEHKSAEAYLFRMPYLGAYCGLKVEIVPAWTDTILVNPDDALQLEGDFDGDSYYVIPAKYVQDEDHARKPERPGKGAKAEIPLSDVTILKAIFDQATVKSAIGIRDTKLNIAQDQLLFHRYSKDGNENLIPYWEDAVQKLQVYVQQAVEGLKHETKGSVTDKDADELLGEATLNPLSVLFTNALLGRQVGLRGTRAHPGYMTQIKAALASGDHSWHPFYPIFEYLSTFEFGEVLDLRNYHPAIKSHKFRASWASGRRTEYEALRGIRKTYSQALATWEGGRNRNVIFGESVLKPIRAQWHRLIQPYVDFDEEAGIYTPKVNCENKLWDLHRMLADVSYEPTPNWAMMSQIKTRDAYGRMRMGLIPRMRSGQVQPKLFTKTVEKLGIRYDPREADLRWTEWFEIDRGYASRRVGYRKQLAQKGAIFHHLAQGEYVREILAPVLPKNEVLDKDGNSLTGLFESLRKKIEDFRDYSYNG